MKRTMQNMTGGLFWNLTPHNFYIPTKLEQNLKLCCHTPMNSFSCQGGITSSSCPTQLSAWCRGVGGLDHSVSLRPCRCDFTRPGCFCAKDCLDSVEMYTWCTDVDGLYWAALDCTGLYWAMVGCTGLYWVVLDCTGLN